MGNEHSGEYRTRREEVKPSYSGELEKYGLKLIDYYTAYDDAGALMIGDQNAKSFVSAGFSLVGLNENTDTITLYRRYDGRTANKYGQYWTLEDFNNSWSTRFDLALLNEWNKMTEKTTIIVPPCIKFFVGKIGPQEEAPGGSLQVFIPRDYLNDIIGMQSLLEYNRDSWKVLTPQYKKLLISQNSFFQTSMNILSNNGSNLSSKRIARLGGCPRCGK
jgi:hypothetical protein